MINRILARRQNDADDHWISLSDIMTSLMMLFLLISVIYMLQVQESVDLPKIFKEDQTALHSQMQQTFEGKLTQWGALLSPDLSVRFNHADVQFMAGSAALRPQFQHALDDFFPQYIKILHDPQYADRIKEIRIEGHTSTQWAQDTPLDEAYLNNMQLSQQRAQATLIYLLTQSPLSTIEKAWLKPRLRAIGYSSAQPLNSQGQPIQTPEAEDPIQSQRVEFRVVTDAEDRIRQIAAGQ
ncbi:MAG: OmpA family protein [Pseudomonadota bacterium]|nr:OmpA family protein [Pseudomonadota bacterium]